jgi:glycosyltransferase involved in cell wall biosynthesis
MACGCPVVSTDCPSGPWEILDGGRLGRLVRVGDSAALAAAIAETLDQPPDRQAPASHAERFSLASIAESYEILLSGKGDAGAQPGED